MLKTSENNMIQEHIKKLFITATKDSVTLYINTIVCMKLMFIISFFPSIILSLHDVNYTNISRLMKIYLNWISKYEINQLYHNWISKLK